MKPKLKLELARQYVSKVCGNDDNSFEYFRKVAHLYQDMPEYKADIANYNGYIRDALIGSNRNEVLLIWMILFIHDNKGIENRNYRESHIRKIHELYKDYCCDDQCLRVNDMPHPDNRPGWMFYDIQCYNCGWGTPIAMKCVDSIAE